MKTVTAITIILFLVFWVGASPANAQAAANENISAEQVLDRYVEAVGGLEAVEKLDARACYGMVTTDLTSRAEPTHEKCKFEFYSKLPRKSLQFFHKDSGVERFGYNGATGWRKIDNEVSDDSETGKSKLDWLINPHDAIVLQDYFPDLSYQGTETREGKTVHVLVPSGLDPEHYALYFDAESGLLIGIGNYWLLEDYREVDGVLFPHRVVVSRKGGSTTYVFNEVKHRVAIDSGIFDKPEK